MISLIPPPPPPPLFPLFLLLRLLVLDHREEVTGFDDGIALPRLHLFPVLSGLNGLFGVGVRPGRSRQALFVTMRLLQQHLEAEFFAKALVCVGVVAGVLNVVDIVPIVAHQVALLASHIVVHVHLEQELLRPSGRGVLRVVVNLDDCVVLHGRADRDAGGGRLGGRARQMYHASSRQGGIQKPALVHDHDRDFTAGGVRRRQALNDDLFDSQRLTCRIETVFNGRSEVFNEAPLRGLERRALGEGRA
mmetsp:Transcript_3371/g.6312  ORF Transcript_3371/g.6312 Transcript_3371/m.6312 type:complete len:248 (+) Transcript_3371:1155-1898(+)